MSNVALVHRDSGSPSHLALLFNATPICGQGSPRMMVETTQKQYICARCTNILRQMNELVGDV